MTFVLGTSAKEEEKKEFWRQSNSEFLTKKQDEMKKMTEQKKDTRTCFQCNKVGHIARECYKAIQSKQGVSRKLKEKVVNFEPPIDRTKLFKNSTFEIGECSNKFYQKKAKSDNQKWVVKKAVESSSDDSDRSKSEELSSGDESDSTKSDEPQVVSKCEAILKDEKSVPIVNDEDFHHLGLKIIIRKLVKLKFLTNFIMTNRILMLRKFLTLR
ncbi:putative transcription factor interactor and regulator CCHC(Zn) family [Helianthus annuus]|nr:putative transcription factor interactor and regulator CCHC(Zn) family [Helianthus annuus]